MPRINLNQLNRLNADGDQDLMTPLSWNGMAIEAALCAEAQLGYMVPSGRYWEVASKFDAQKLSAIDDLWLRAVLHPVPELA
jgi:hypothetical protein